MTRAATSPTSLMTTATTTGRLLESADDLQSAPDGDSSGSDDDSSDSELERQAQLLKELKQKREADARRQARMKQQADEYASIKERARREAKDAKLARKLARQQKRKLRREQRRFNMQAAIDSEIEAAKQRAQAPAPAPAPSPGADASSSLGLQDPPTSFHPILQNQGAADGESVASCGKADCDHAPCHDSRQSRPHATVLAAELNSAFAGTGAASPPRRCKGSSPRFARLWGRLAPRHRQPVRLSDSGIQLGRVGSTDRSPDLSDLDRNRGRSSVQKCVDIDFDIVGSRYKVSTDAKFELLHGRVRDRTGDDMEEHKVADGVYLSRKRKPRLQMPEIQSRDQMIRIERQMDEYINGNRITFHSHQESVAPSSDVRLSHRRQAAAYKRRWVALSALFSFARDRLQHNHGVRRRSGADSQGPPPLQLHQLHLLPPHHRRRARRRAPAPISVEERQASRPEEADQGAPPRPVRRQGASCHGSLRCPAQPWRCRQLSGRFSSCDAAESAATSRKKKKKKNKNKRSGRTIRPPRTTSRPRT